MRAATPRRGGRGAGGAAESPAARSLSASATPTLVECPGNDDERERRQRRRSRAVDLQLGGTESPLSLCSPVPRQADASLPALSGWTNAQISEHYSACIKLSAENKINTRNVFGLHLIDYMTDILKQKDSELTNFKMAAGTIDASVKIYAVRVDAVHADTYKVLGGLGKESAPAKEVGSPEEEEDSTASSSAKRVQTKKKHSFKTIEQNLNNINVTEANRRCEVDPMFQKTAASFDECSTAGIFLTSLRTQSCHSELLFDSNIVPLPSSETLVLPNSDPVKVTDLKLLLEKCAVKRPIYSALADFQFMHWDAASHEESVSALLDKFKKSDQVFDINAERDSDVEDGVPAPSDDDFTADSPRSVTTEKIGEFAGNKSLVALSESKRIDAVSFGEGDIGTMCLHLSMKPGEYSYFSPRTLSMWAGPEHWRFRPRHKSSADSEKENKKKKAKKAFEVNFDEDVDFETYFRKTKAAVTLSKSILENQNVKSTTLPADFNYNPNNIVQLFLKPAAKLFRLPKPGSSLDHEDEIGEYDYNNPNDTSNFCPAAQAADSDDDNDPVQFMGQADFNLTSHPEGHDHELNGVDGVDITMYGELNLIAEPQKVNKIAIQYAKTAKKMDMKRLKQNMWDLLIDIQKNTAAEIEDVEKQSDISVVTGEKAFSSITKELLHRLPSVMAKNLSVPLAFACLLHLANEKNLKLNGTEDLSDVIVKQGD
ncbi:condensin complex subunit 2 [Tympanuchus pallidicinctus]|uniref:condensin complex subunit 2 n=1 Tax=Tympanuchus pallidicinctus TaxID=109042 RepID=UPI002286DBAB|nr:condensin complex subunit 2 [Tympanuchus pallidicinctus]